MLAQREGHKLQLVAGEVYVTVQIERFPESVLCSGTTRKTSMSLHHHLQHTLLAVPCPAPQKGSLNLFLH